MEVWLFCKHALQIARKSFGAAFYRNFRHFVATKSSLLPFTFVIRCFLLFVLLSGAILRIACNTAIVQNAHRWSCSKGVNGDRSYQVVVSNIKDGIANRSNSRHFAMYNTYYSPQDAV
jgi:hypothetical protein